MDVVSVPAGTPTGVHFAALTDGAMNAEVAERLRGLLTTIRMIPEDGKLAIELVGELAAIIALGASPTQKAPAFLPGLLV